MRLAKVVKTITVHYIKEQRKFLMSLWTKTSSQRWTLQKLSEAELQAKVTYFYDLKSKSLLMNGRLKKFWKSMISVINKIKLHRAVEPLTAFLCLMVKPPNKRKRSFLLLWQQKLTVKSPFWRGWHKLRKTVPDSHSWKCWSKTGSSDLWLRPEKEDKPAVRPPESLEVHPPT